jgi:hypothetical protein
MTCQLRGVALSSLGEARPAAGLCPRAGAERSRPRYLTLAYYLSQ